MTTHDDKLFAELGALFAKANRQLFLVGGSVRDITLSREVKDWDFTTNATPEEIEEIVIDWCDALWDVGRDFGTIALRKRDVDIEITTFRIDGPGRKPTVEFSDSLLDDLRRRDFTVNAMACPVTAEGIDFGAESLIDPFGGMGHLLQRVLDTPRSAEECFNDDPLRMMRAARFSAQLGFNPSKRVMDACRGLGPRIKTISAERVQAELTRLLSAPFPEKGVRFMHDSKLLRIILPGVSAIDTYQMLLGDDWQTRLADLMRQVGPFAVREIMMRLKMSNADIQLVTNLVTWVHRFEKSTWTDGAVRRLIAAAGEDLERILTLMGDITLDARAREVLEREGHPEPPLTGKEIMDVLGVEPGPRVGEAQRFLWQSRLDGGPQTKDNAERTLKAWAALS
jgi:poly(A) polymerase